MKKIGIYIHVPFCLRKCNYCDFCSFPGQGREQIETYITALKSHIASYSGRLGGYVADTVYFGGGTPTLLDPEDFAGIISALRGIVPIEDDAEISAECNPATADEEKLLRIASAGVNRLSIGAQSFNDSELQLLGRLHSANDVRRIFADARRAGFDNISLDLMYGIPSQTRESFAKSLDAAIELCPEHISAYCLKVEDGTPFARMGDRLILPEDDAVFTMYRDCVDKLGAAGIERYEISNFARPGRHSRHNLRYWQESEFIGFGVAAYSYFEKCRFSAPRDMERYLSGEFLDSDSREIIDREGEECEFVMLSMRLAEGMKISEYIDRFGIDPRIKYTERFAPYVATSHVIADDAGWRFTTDGMFVSNHILSDILDL